MGAVLSGDPDRAVVDEALRAFIHEDVERAQRLICRAKELLVAERTVKPEAGRLKSPSTKRHDGTKRNPVKKTSTVLWDAGRTL